MVCSSEPFLPSHPRSMIILSGKFTVILPIGTSNSNNAARPPNAENPASKICQKDSSKISVILLLFSLCTDSDTRCGEINGTMLKADEKSSNGCRKDLAYMVRSENNDGEIRTIF